MFVAKLIILLGVIILTKVLCDTKIDGQVVEANNWVYCNDEHRTYLIQKGVAIDKASEASGDTGILSRNLIDEEKRNLDALETSRFTPWKT